LVALHVLDEFQGLIHVLPHLLLLDDVENLLALLIILLSLWLGRRLFLESRSC
jgi:hypothetical protein